MSIMKTTKNIVGSSVMLGVGGMALEGMGQGALVGNTIGKGASMMGAVSSAAYGSDIMRMMNPRKRRRRR